MADAAYVRMVYGVSGLYFGMEFILFGYGNGSGFSMGLSIWKKQRLG